MRCTRALPALLLALAGAGAAAQTADIDVDGLPVAPLIGEQFCVDSSFFNSDAATGYGPYLIAILDPGMTDAQVDFVDLPPDIEYIGEFGVDDPIVDPVSGTPLTGEPGATVYLARYPVGSVNQGDPQLVMTACGVLLPGVEIGAPLDVTFIPGFEYGDTPTGDNGASLDTGNAFTGTVTPQLARIEKTNTAPEGERTPGPDFPFDYVWTVDISDLVTIDNLALVDNLPAQIQWTGDDIQVDAPLGVNCAVASAPNLPDTPGGQAAVTCDAATGTAATDDLVVTVPVYVSDILDETVPDSEVITNTVDFGYDYDGDAFDNTGDPDSTSDVLAVHAAIQKRVSGGNLPGDMLTYAIDFQVTDYSGSPEGADTFVVSDILPDGMAFAGTVELLVDGASVAIAEGQSAGPGAGQTTLIWDIGAALGDTVENGAAGVLRYQAQILEYYDDGTPVSSSDTLSNSADLAYTLTEGGSGSNDSIVDVEVPPNTPDKELIDPGPGVEIMPGEEVTFRLTMEIPAGKTRSVVFVDVLPQPVFDVTDPVPTVVVPPDAPFYQPATSPAVSTNPANNSVTIDFGDIDTDTGATLAVDLTATVTDVPFADNLYLTNILAASYENAGGTVTQDVEAAAVFVGAPELQITKGVLDTDNPDAILTPANGGDPGTELIDSDAQGVDAGDTVNFILTVENIGGQSAFNVEVSDPAVGDLNCNPAPVSVTDGTGASLSYSGDLQAGLLLDDPLAGNDDNPDGGGAPFGADTALIELSCEVGAAVTPAQTLDNTASVTWTATQASTTPFPAVEDAATLEVARPALAKTVTGISPQYGAAYNASGVHIGEEVGYRLAITVPEGVSAPVEVNDLLDAGLAIGDRNNDGSVDVNDVTVTLPGGVTATSTTDIQVLSEGGGDAGVNRRLLIDLGTVSNTNSSNGSPEQIVIEYQAKVNNSAGNVSGQQRRNRAEWSWQDAGGATRSVTVSAPAVTVLEPQLSISKTLDPVTGDGTTQPVVQLVIANSGASNGDAFDVALSDVMPEFTDAGGTTYDLMDILPGTVAFDAGCPAFSLSPTATAERLDAAWEVFPLNSSCTISFQTDVLDIIPAGVQINNCADLAWESMNDTSQPPDQVPLGYERTGDAADPGELNDYAARNCASFKFQDVGIAKSVFATDQAQTDNIAGTPPETESLTIGETIEFDLVVTVPESPVYDLVVSDLLPTTEMVLELISAQHLANGQDIYPEGGSAGDSLSPTVSAPADTNGDGVPDRVELAYGNIGHDLDGTDDEDRIRIRVTARVLDRPENANGDVDENTANVNYQVTPGGDRANKADTYGIEIVEPLVQVEKTADVTEIEAGDTVTYRLLVSHSTASRVNAEDFSLGDELPPQLSLVANSLSEGECAVSPDALTEGADRIDATWAEFPLGASCELTFEAVVDITAVTGSTISNQADVAWTSLVGQGDANDRDYEASDTWEVLVSLPGLAKVISHTDSDDTPFTPGEPVTQLTIGETVTFLMTASMPDGTTEAVTITDVLPADARLLVDTTASELVRIGSDIDLPTGPSAGALPTCSEAGSGPATYTQQCEWVLGDVINQPDTRADPDLDDQIVFRVVATVIDVPENSGVPGVDDSVANVVRLDSPDVQLLAQAVFDIVEPRLDLEKTTANGGKAQAVEAGESHRFTLSISHTADSTANARTVVVTDTLDPDMLWQGNVASSCPELVTSDPGVGNSGAVTFSLDTLPLAQSACEISFDIEMTGSAPSAGVFPNSAALAWESDPTSVLPASRSGADDSAAILFNLSDAYLEKEVVATSVPGTTDTAGDSALPDATIGELVEYRITAHFAEGTTEDVVITDTLQSAGGVLAYEAGEVLLVGDNITTGQGAPTVSIAGNIITLDYGTVINAADLEQDRNDTIVYRLLARVVDDGANVDGNVLDNQVLMEFTGVSSVAGTRTAQADVDVVEPELSLNKTFTALSGGVATVELELTNTGTAPAYDALITDDLDEALWVAGSVTAVDVPPGFVLSESSDNLMEVALALDPLDPAVPTPAQVLVPGESLAVTFEVTLREDRTPADIDQIPNSADAAATSLPGPHPGVERSYSATAAATLDLPVLALAKSVSDNPAAPGDALTYTLTLQNSGAAAASNVVITDTPDGNGDFQSGTVVVSAPDAVIDLGNTGGDSSIQVTLPSVAAGATVEVSYEVRVPSPYPDGSDATAVPQQLDNQASASSDELPALLSDGDTSTPGTAEPTVVEILADPVMTIAKDDQRLFVEAGQTIEYLLTYGNAGNQDASGVVLSDTVPANTTFNAAASSPGWVCAGGGGPGSACTYTVSGGVAGASTASVVFAVDVDSNLAPGVTEITNSADITEDGQEFGAPDDSPSTDTDTEETPLDPVRTGPDLIIDKDDGGISVVPGQVFAYTLSYVNTGTQTATGVVITETVPSYTVFDAAASTPGWSCANGSPPPTTCTLAVGTLPPAESRTALFGLQVIAPMPSGVSQTANTARIADDGSNSPLPQIDDDSDTTPIDAAPELAITKATDVRVAHVGDLVVYNIEFINQGNQDATGVVIREVVAPGAVYSAPDSAGTAWSCADRSPAGTVCQYSVGPLAVGAGGALTFATRVVEEPDRYRLANVVEINDDGNNGPDLRPANNIDTVVTPFPAKDIPLMDHRMLILLAMGLCVLGLSTLTRGGRRA